MTLAALIQKRKPGSIATAIPAIFATDNNMKAGTVARIATIAVANPKAEAVDVVGYYPTHADIDLLDSLINELCDLQGDKAETREAMLDARRKMPPVLIPENIAQLRLWIAEVNHSETMKGQA